MNNVEGIIDITLRGKRIVFLGSSVTAGSFADNTSFVEYLCERDGIIPLKEAVPSTTLADIRDDSYISRMKRISTEYRADAFVCQLSTNDVRQGIPMGKIAADKEACNFDTSTIVGGIEYIIYYVKKTWACPIIFYTGSRFDCDAYGKLVDVLYELQKKWEIYIIDLWNNLEFNMLSDEERCRYIKDDGIHPYKAGYREWWTPQFEIELTKILSDVGFRRNERWLSTKL